VVAKPKPSPDAIDQTPALVKVAVTSAEYQTVNLAVTAHGTVTPIREIDLVAQVSGRIIHVEPAFADGGFFGADETLIQIDDRDYQVALLTAKAKLAEAQRRLAEEQGQARQAKREWRDLGNSNANDLFLRRPQLAAAQANLDAAQGDLTMAELNLERTKITVPFTGRVKQTYANLGQYVTTNTRVATVYDSTALQVRLALTERQAALVDLPLLPQADINSPLPNVIIRGSVAGKQQEWRGELARTEAFVDANSRLYYIVVEVANPYGNADEKQASIAPLLPGLFVEAVIEGKALDDVVMLPREALYQRDKILSLDADNKVTEQLVNVLQKDETHVWLKAAIPENTLIALEKQSLTPNGTIVEPILDENAEPLPIAQTEVLTEARQNSNRAANQQP
jgi:RND family efflux transporter, MFP subunit